MRLILRSLRKSFVSKMSHLARVVQWYGISIISWRKHIRIRQKIWKVIWLSWQIDWVRWWTKWNWREWDLRLSYKTCRREWYFIKIMLGSWRSWWSKIRLWLMLLWLERIRPLGRDWGRQLNYMQCRKMMLFWRKWKKMNDIIIW